MKLSEIKPNPKNPRVIKDDKFKKLKKSIQDFPQMLELREIVVDENMVILGGNMRYKALLDLGIKEAPVKVATGLTEEQKEEFIMKDNIGFGEWDWDLLANEYDTELLADWGLDTPETLDYSDANQEISTESLGNESFLTFKYSHQDYLNVLDLLNNAKEKLECITNEETLKKLLADYE